MGCSWHPKGGARGDAQAPTVLRLACERAAVEKSSPEKLQLTAHRAEAGECSRAASPLLVQKKRDSGAIGRQELGWLQTVHSTAGGEKVAGGQR